MTAKKQSKGGLATIFLTVLIDLIGFGIVLPLLPIYSQVYGATEIELGILFSCFSAMQFVFAPLWGRLSDRIGRKPILIGGLFGTAVAYALFGLADSLTALMVARLLSGCFGATVSTAQAYIADVTEPKDRAKGMGMIGAAFGLGMTIGPLIGGHMFAWHPSAPGFFAAGFSALAATFGLFMLKEPDARRADGSRTFGMQALGKILSNSRVRTVIGLYFMSIMAFSAFEAMFIRFGLVKFPEVFYSGEVPLDAANIGLDQMIEAAPIAGNYLFFIGLISAFVQGGLIRRLVPRFGEIKLIIAGPIFLGLSLAIIGLAPNWTVVILGCLFMPFGIGFNNPSLQSLLSRSAEADMQGATLGVNQSSASLARVVGPVLAGWSFTHLGPESPLLLAAAILFGAAVVAFLFGRKHGASYSLGAEGSTKQ